MHQRNIQKSAKLYDYIDSSSFYTCKVEQSSRSLMNVCFFLPNSELEASFLKQAEQIGLVALKGHKLIGGIRASLYNAMPMEGVDRLLNFMHDFARAPQR